MDTIEKLSTYAKICNCPINFIGIPKTIDNDLMNIDYTPGYLLPVIMLLPHYVKLLLTVLYIQ